MRNIITRIVFGVSYYLPSWVWLDKLMTSLTIWWGSRRWPKPDCPRRFSDVTMGINFKQINGLRGLTANKYYLRYYAAKLPEKPNFFPMISHLRSLTDLDKLRTQPFQPIVMKPAHGSGFVYFANTPKALASAECTKFCQEMFDLRYDRLSKQATYGFFERSVIVERNMCIEPGISPKDYKIHCFHGEPLLIQLDEDRFQSHKQTFYSPDWNFFAVRVLDKASPAPSLEKRPKALSKLIETARLLSADFDYVRVDLYLLGERVYVGELTHFPWGGKYNFLPIAFDEDLVDVYAKRMTTSTFIRKWKSAV